MLLILAIFTTIFISIAIGCALAAYLVKYINRKKHEKALFEEQLQKTLNDILQNSTKWICFSRNDDE